MTRKATHTHKLNSCLLGLKTSQLNIIMMSVSHSEKKKKRGEPMWLILHTAFLLKMSEKVSIGFSQSPGIWGGRMIGTRSPLPQDRELIQSPVAIPCPAGSNPSGCLKPQLDHTLEANAFSDVITKHSPGTYNFQDNHLVFSYSQFHRQKIHV